MIARNLSQFVRHDGENQTAYLELGNGGYWWCWWGSDLEAQAYALKFFLSMARGQDENAKVARGLARYLHNNRRYRDHWTNTRDTGLAIEALTEYCTKREGAEGEDRPIYVNAYFTYMSAEEPIKSAGLEVKVNRVVMRDGVELKDGAEVKSGDELEIRLDVDSKNDYEYIAIEDRKGSGFEPVDTRSGYHHLKGGWGYVEFRDRHTAIFLRELRRGACSLTYKVRVENPGVIHVLPTSVHAMYAPRLRGNSDEIRLTVTER